MISAWGEISKAIINFKIVSVFLILHRKKYFYLRSPEDTLTELMPILATIVTK